MQNDFEKLLKQKANNFSLKPSANVWLNVEQEIKERRRKRILGWWLLAASLFIVIAVGSIMYLQNSNSINKASVSFDKEIETSKSRKVTQVDNANNSSQKDETPKSNTETQNNTLSSSEIKSGKETTQNLKEPEISPNKKITSTDHSTLKSKNKIVETYAIADSELSNGDALENNINSMPLGKHPLFSNSTEQQILFNSETTVSAFTIATHSSRFTIEADALACFTYVKNNSLLYESESYIVSNSSSNGNSFYDSGFSAGVNLFYQIRKTWFAGSGIHFTKTKDQLDFAQFAAPVFDTTFDVADTSGFANIVSIDTINLLTHQYLNPTNSWIDFSLFAGVNLFPDSKNHLRILAGAAYTRLIITNGNSSNISQSDLATTNDPFEALNSYSVSYNKNQLQLFTEISWLHDFTLRVSMNAGMQFHYYTINLYENNQYQRNMFWMGLKGGIIFKL